MLAELVRHKERLITLHRYRYWDVHEDDYWRLEPEQRDEVCALVRMHGFDYCDVYRVEYDVIDLPCLTLGVYLRDDDGHHYADVDRDDQAARQTLTVALRTPLPDWWRRLIGLDDHDEGRGDDVR